METKTISGLKCKCGHSDTHNVYPSGPHIRCDCGKCGKYIKFVSSSEARDANRAAKKEVNKNKPTYKEFRKAIEKIIKKPFKRLMTLEQYLEHKKNGTLPETTNKSTVWKD